MKKNICNFLFFVFCILITSCKKETAPELEYLKIPDEVWSYVNLTPGSWYIYKDSATGLTDSVVVTRSVINYKAPVLNFITGSTIFYTDDYQLTLEKVDLAGNKTLWLDATSNGVTIFGVNAWYFPGLLQYPYILPGFFTVDKISAATIEGNNYSVILIREGGAWWVKGIGLIRLTYRGKTFTLLRKK